MKRRICGLLLALLLFGLSTASAAEKIAYVTNDGLHRELYYGEEALDLAAKQPEVTTRVARVLKSSEIDVLGITKKSYKTPPTLKDINAISEYCLYNLLLENYSFRFYYAGTLKDADINKLAWLPFMYFPMNCELSLQWKRYNSTYMLYTVTYYADQDEWISAKNTARSFYQKNYSRGMTNKQYIRLAHDMVAKSCVYDNSIVNTSLDALSSQFGHFHGQQAYCAFNCRKSLCAGYANALQLLGLYAGVNIHGIYGEAEGVAHKWNCVISKDTNDRGWRYIDLTYDDQDYGIIYDYFWKNSLNSIDGRLADAGTNAFLTHIGAGNK